MDYSKALGYIDSFINFEQIPKYDYARAFKLDRMRALLEELGNPHKELKVIHVAGSKGKGSTCAILAYILREAGYRVGLYTSPHLVDLRERIRVLEKGTSGKQQETRDFEGTIEEKEFIELIEKIRPVAERFRDHETLGKLSFFEVLTACAFLYFRKMNVDFAVIETGLGGRLDATNVCESVVCGIANISLEHTDKLGSSLREIAREKAGIIKAGGWRLETGGAVFSVSQEKEVMEVLREVCQERGAILHEVGKLDENLALSLLGRHQLENAGLAIAMLKSIEGLKMDEEAIRAGLLAVKWPGRLQIIQRNPYIILDGAQNVASIKSLLSSIKELFSYERVISVFGILSDKDIEGVTKELDKFSDVIILTKAKYTQRSVEPVSLSERFLRPIEVTSHVEEALEKAERLANKDDLILVTGSLYVVGEALKSQKHAEASA